MKSNYTETKNNNKQQLYSSVGKWIVYGLIIVILLFWDQWTKILAINNLKDKNSIVIFKDIFELSYVENRGAAFGMLTGRVDFFVIITCILIPVLVYAIYKINSIVKVYSDSVNIKAYKVLQFDFVVLIAGALGNFIDRVLNGYVVDFLYFKLIDFPVFNVADIYVTLATIVLLYMMFFVFKERELDFILCSKKKWDEISNKEYNDDKKKVDITKIDTDNCEKNLN